MPSQLLYQLHSWFTRITGRQRRSADELPPLPAALQPYQEKLRQHFASFQTITGVTQVALRPRTAANYSLRGEAYRQFVYQTGNNQETHRALYELALADTNKAITLQPEWGYYYYQRGMIYMQGYHRNDQAIADFTRAIDLGCDIPEVYFNRGLLYHWRSEPEQARADFAQVQHIRGFHDYTPPEYQQ